MDIKYLKEFIEAARTNSLNPHMDITAVWRRSFNYESTLNTDTQEYVRTALAHQHLPRFLPGSSVIKLIAMFAVFGLGVWGMFYLIMKQGVSPNMPEFVGYAVAVTIGILMAVFVSLMLDFELDAVTLQVLKPRPTKSLDNPLGGQLRYVYSSGHVRAVENSSLEAYMDLIGHSPIKLSECKLTRIDATYFGKMYKSLFALDAYLTLTGFLACKKEMPLALEVATNPDSDIDKETVRKAQCAIVEYTAVALEPAYQAFKLEQLGDIERNKKQSKLIAAQIDADFERAMAPKLDTKDIEL